MRSGGQTGGQIPLFRTRAMHGVRSEALRAYLLVASVAAITIDLIALYAGWVLQIPDSVFYSTPFRILAILVILAAVVAVRLRCGMAFRSAIGSGDAVAHDDQERAIVVNVRCPKRRLVCLYARLSGRRAVLTA
jgi:hypothetical protein